MSAKKQSPEAVALTFEVTIQKLESIVTSMQEDDSTLEDSLQNFEEGIRLIKDAQNTLAAAEQKLSLLLESDGKPQAQDVEPPL